MKHRIYLIPLSLLLAAAGPARADAFGVRSPVTALTPGAASRQVKAAAGRRSPKPQDAATRVWTSSQTVRFLRDAQGGAGHVRRSLGGVGGVKIAAARNEWESFQILLRSDIPVAGVKVAAGDLRGPAPSTGSGLGRGVIRGDDARIYRQHQMHVKIGTHRNKNFRAGWYPDGLIPARHPATRKPLTAGRLRAMPFDLPAGQTHGFWIDLYVPTTARAGTYRGKFTVSAGKWTVDVPVTLEVWDFALPRTVSLQTALGSPAARMRGYYASDSAKATSDKPRAKAGKEKPPADWPAVEAQCAELLTRHRINCLPPADMLRPREQDDGSWRIPADKIRALKAFVARYQCNAIRIPHPRSAVKDPEAEGKPFDAAQGRRLAAWLKSFDAAAKALRPAKVVFYTYLKDEPNDEAAYRYVQKLGRAIRRAGSVVKVMVVEQTWTQNEKWGDLYGAVDIWCPLFSLLKPASARRRLAAGETVWTYTALCQREETPWWHIDFPLQNYRVPAWIAWRYGISGLLYWGGMSFWKQVDDPWTDPKTLDRRGADGRGPLYNGEGSIVYPARAAGYEGIAPSLRLKALRDSIEDFEYLAILERAGRGEDARKIVLPLAQSSFKWSRDPAAWQKGRRKLAALIVAKMGTGKLLKKSTSPRMSRITRMQTASDPS